MVNLAGIAKNVGTMKGVLSLPMHGHLEERDAERVALAIARVHGGQA